MQTCGNCCFFLSGVCKYNPPPQPAVEASDWCSHWCPGPSPESPADARVDSAGDVE